MSPQAVTSSSKRKSPPKERSKTMPAVTASATGTSGACQTDSASASWWSARPACPGQLGMIDRCRESEGLLPYRRLSLSIRLRARKNRGGGYFPPPPRLNDQSGGSPDEEHLTVGGQRPEV